MLDSINADFTSSFWGLYVAGLVTISLLVCVLILVLNMTSRETGAPQVQAHTWDETLQEYNNPLPKWWLYLFWGTLVFAVVYLAVFPGYGTANDDRGARAEYAKETEKFQQVFDKYAKVDVAALAQQPEAVATGKRLFLTYCIQCHGSNAKGSPGFPDLTDNDWLYGGEADTVKTSILEGRAGVMNAFGAVLSGDEIKDVANYVRSLSGLSADAARVQRGEAVFAANCTVCHGPDGKGAASMGAAFAALGAPNLTDNVWLYGNSEAKIIEGVTRGRNFDNRSLKNAMPAWGEFLGEGKVTLLAAYVHSLSQKK
ncbi:cytochrome c oxidase, cbb3-type subunit III [Betaproteobacteria bacterium]|nr:cytochrome c oxidase, cbb3-type subunit III [Betaproteobacteria bacterium]GHU03527.1 cytochrome c oxidase, cbb3-type subunit III [Betaproteobacteria bacterium]GHU17893.1 cytochrome c oxidase, cbb3-type subunit III [Betaproteobacteria bacterium]